MRPGKPVHISQILGVSAVVNTIDSAEVDVGGVPPQFRVDIPRRRSVVDTVAQDLAGPNWNGGPILSGRNKSKTGRGGQTSRFTIRNVSPSGGQSMDVSFDRGNNFLTLDPGGSFTWEIDINFFVVRPVNLAAARASDITFQALAVVH
jgi:hypothetical protein